MTRLDKIKILSLDWTIEKNKDTTMEGNCYGSTHHSSQKIFLDPNATEQHLDEVYLHEILHAIFWQMGLGKMKEFSGKEGRDLEEVVVHHLASGLTAVFKDNDMLK